MNPFLSSFGHNAEKFPIDNAFVLPKINLHDADPTQLNSICQSYSHLKEISFPDFSDNQIGLILGQDNFDLITAKAVFKGPDNAPRAVLTDIGWTIGGPNDTSFELLSFQAPVYQSDEQDKDLYDLIATFWRMDTYGTSPEVTMSHDEKHALQTLKATTPLQCTGKLFAAFRGIRDTKISLLVRGMLVCGIRDK